MLHEKAALHKVLTSVLVFAFAFMCVRPMSVLASGTDGIIIDEPLIYPTVVRLDSGQSKTVRDSCSCSITGLTVGYVYDVSFYTFFTSQSPTRTITISYTDRSCSLSTGDSVTPPVGGQDYTTRITATSDTLVISLSYSALLTNTSSSDARKDMYCYVTSVSCEFVSTGDLVLDELQKQTEVQKGQLEEQKKQTDIMEEQNETGKGILSKITDFFGGFFDNLMNAVVSLVIPSSDDLFALLGEVNDWFGERLGFIWYPFGLMADLVSALGSGTADQYLAIPAVTLNLLGEQYTIFGGTEVDIDAFGFFGYVRFFTSALMVSGVCRLAINKWDAWIAGRGTS